MKILKPITAKEVYRSNVSSPLLVKIIDIVNFDGKIVMEDLEIFNDKEIQELQENDFIESKKVEIVEDDIAPLYKTILDAAFISINNDDIKNVKVTQVDDKSVKVEFIHTFRGVEEITSYLFGNCDILKGE